jgi:acetoin utilization deacetylase AcuC-like enzyme
VGFNPRVKKVEGVLTPASKSTPSNNKARASAPGFVRIVLQRTTLRRRLESRLYVDKVTLLLELACDGLHRVETRIDAIVFQVVWAAAEKQIKLAIVFLHMIYDGRRNVIVRSHGRHHTKNRSNNDQGRRKFSET